MSFISIRWYLRCPDIPHTDISIFVTSQKFVIRIVDACGNWVLCQHTPRLSHLLYVDQFHCVIWWTCYNSVLVYPVYSIYGVLVERLGCYFKDVFLVKMHFLLLFLCLAVGLVLWEEVGRDLVNTQVAFVVGNAEMTIIQRVQVDS